MSQEGGQSGAKRVSGAVLGVLLGAGFVVLCPADAGLTGQGACCLGVLLGAVVWWVAEVLPAYATGLLMVVLFVVVGGVNSSVALSAFSSSTWWLLLAAFGLGAAMKRSGLMRRMALAIVRIFPNTFSAQVAGLMAAGTLVGPLVPSMAAKVSMLTPLAMGMGDALGYERYGKPMQGLFLAVFCGVRSVAPAVLSASVIGYCLLGLLPAGVQARFDLLHWLLAALPWFVLVTALTFATIVIVYRPRGEKAAIVGMRRLQGEGPVPESSCDKAEGASEGAAQPAPKEEGATEDAARSASPHNALTAMTRHEKQMALIMALTVAAWVAEPLHHVPAHIVALAALALVVACGIMGKTGFREDISWESLVFVGVAMGLAEVFQATGIQEWVVAVAGPAFQALAGNPYLFVAGAALITVALRFVIVSEMAYLNIVMVFLVPLSASAGLNPWVIGFALYSVITPWFALYQSATYLAAFYSVDGKMVRHADMARYCVLYTAICIAGLLVSVPYWQLIGVL